MIITDISICLTDLPKEKFTISEKNGKKYINLNVSIFDEKDKFGNDVAVTLKQTQIERETEEKKVYVGNGKKVYEKASNKPTEQKQAEVRKVIDSDLPF